LYLYNGVPGAVGNYRFWKWKLREHEKREGEWSKEVQRCKEIEGKVLLGRKRAHFLFEHEERSFNKLSRNSILLFKG